ncbi:hypothetical protein OG455_41220 [Kitasatospora sp. NBC_01287]|uniref:hypothetical protein n=1 Tax=Kitasatospora sp. NBC_01287 TaxID=2903573 RepID=UPI002252F6C5|nr:hypothetical protein [Kitasatospora sp. NBC_01287]MCX4750904.1 hypothetical protein [Kitasatospora sp. NBC_01287]MCX4751863.1 hypothetical protein [Kitasatospora sp. NBC_01287]
MMQMPATPYITPAMLTSAPAGISWTVVPTLTANTQQQAAQLAQVCWQATSAVDRYCRQPLRAVINTETGSGPGLPRIASDRSTCRGTIVTRRWPVTAVEAIQTSPSTAFPQQWTVVPAGQWKIRQPVIMTAAPTPDTGPSGGNVIDVAPGYITWDRGRGGWDVMTSYQSGHPHAGLTATATAGAQTVLVDDVTGWAGAVGFLYDGVSTELVEVASVAATVPVQLPGVAGAVQAGPGVLTLSQPLTFNHSSDAVLSALPPDVIRATALQASVMALETIDAISTQSLSGQMAGGTTVLAEEVEMILDDYRRVA